MPGVVVNTPKELQRSCGIGNVGLEKTKPGDMGTILMDKYKIFTAPIDGAGVKGCRISPNVYTSLEELDRLILSLKDMASLPDNFFNLKVAKPHFLVCVR